MRGELDWIVMKALEKDRRRRYETANDFAADVMRYLTDQPVEACPPSAWYRFAQVRPPEPGGPDDGRAGRPGPGSSGTAVSIWQAVRATRAERATAEGPPRHWPARPSTRCTPRWPRSGWRTSPR